MATDKWQDKPLRREHLTDEQWSDFCKIAQFVYNWKRRRLATLSPVAGINHTVVPRES